MLRSLVVALFLATGCARGVYIRAIAVEKADAECATKGKNSDCLVSHWGPIEVDGITKYGTKIECECTTVR